MKEKETEVTPKGVRGEETGGEETGDSKLGTSSQDPTLKHEGTIHLPTTGSV